MRLLGHLLFWTGVLWIALSGLCTAFFAWLGHGFGGPEGAVTALAIGAVAIALGLIPLLWGRSILRRERS